VSDEALRGKRRRVRWVQRYLLNPAMKALTWAGLSPGHVLIETRGRRTGRRRRNVVGMNIVDDVGWVVAEQGPQAGWVRNISADPNVRVRVRRRWRPAHARVAYDDDPGARLDAFGRRSHAAAVRRFGTELTSVRFDFDR